MLIDYISQFRHHTKGIDPRYDLVMYDSMRRTKTKKSTTLGIARMVLDKQVGLSHVDYEVLISGTQIMVIKAGTQYDPSIIAEISLDRRSMFLLPQGARRARIIARHFKQIKSSIEAFFYDAESIKYL
jgi:hypothetical protein